MSIGQIWPQASNLHSLAGHINGQTDQAAEATGVYQLPHRPHRLPQERAGGAPSWPAQPGNTARHLAPWRPGPATGAGARHLPQYPL